MTTVSAAARSTQQAVAGGTSATAGRWASPSYSRPCNHSKGAFHGVLASTLPLACNYNHFLLLISRLDTF